MAASHRIWLQLTMQLMANGSLHTGSVGRVRVNFLGFDWLPAYLKLFQARLPWLLVMVSLLHVGRLMLAISQFVSRNQILYEATFR